MDLFITLFVFVTVWSVLIAVGVSQKKKVWEGLNVHLGKPFDGNSGDSDDSVHLKLKEWKDLEVLESDDQGLFQCIVCLLLCVLRSSLFNFQVLLTITFLILMVNRRKPRNYHHNQPNILWLTTVFMPIPSVTISSFSEQSLPFTKCI